MWEFDNKNGCMLKNWCFWTVVLERTLENPLGCKEIKPVNPKGNQLWIFIGRTNAEAEAPVIWSPDAKNWLTGKDPDAGKDWEQEEKGMTEDEMVGRHHWLNRHEFEQTLGDGEGQGSLMCYSPGGHNKSYVTKWLNKLLKLNYWIILVWTSGRKETYLILGGYWDGHALTKPLLQVPENAGKGIEQVRLWEV